MKKSLSLILTVLLVSLCFVSCSGGGGVGGEGESSSVTESPSGDISDEGTEADTGIIESPTESEGQTSNENPTENENGGTPEGIKYLRSDSGTQLNMILEYDVAKNGDGSYTVDATLKLESYSLRVTARDNSNYIKIGDENFYYSTEEINYSGTEKTTFTVATHKFTVNADGGELPVYAVWYFNGTYNNKPLSAIIIDGKITLE